MIDLFSLPAFNLRTATGTSLYLMRRVDLFLDDSKGVTTVCSRINSSSGERNY